MKHTINFFVIAFCTLQIAWSQSYFQQEVNYTIHVTLDDAVHVLRGDVSFEYINHSAKVIDSIYVHLWPNAYKNAKTALAKQSFQNGDYFLLWAKQYDRGGIDSLSFSVNGQSVVYSYWLGYEDVAMLKLPQSLPPGGRCTVFTPFRVKIPSGTISRLGHIQKSYQITQWFPKPAVYDKDGWHPMPYLTQGEFYSEFGNFDVYVSVPENYVVGASGNLQTDQEKEALSSLVKKSSEDQIAIIEQRLSTSPAPMKTLHYKMERAHDFAWFADRKFIVEKGECILPGSGKRVETCVMYTPENAAEWSNGTGLKAIHDALYYYSLWVGEYPYDVCTAVDGTISAGGGMEYPTITVIGNTGSKEALRMVIIHEVGHNWFYGILGSNERDHAWMDEGLNSFYETRTMLATDIDGANAVISLGGPGINRILGLNDFSYSYLAEELPYLLNARRAKDQPIDFLSDDYTSMNYGAVVYKKTALAFKYLMGFLGEELFDRCMHEYYNQWKFRHPYPQDLKEVFEKTSGKNLSWFFEDVIKTTGRVDYMAVSARRSGADGLKLKVRNRGDIAAPFSVDVMRDGKIVSTSWLEGCRPGKSLRGNIPAEKGDVIIINNADGINEYNKRDNRIRTTGILRRIEPLKLGLLTGVDNPSRTQWFVLPILGWNNYNKTMFGLYLNNQTIPRKHFKWSIAQMFSPATKGMAGFNSIGWDNGYWGVSSSYKKFNLTTLKLGGEAISRSYAVSNTTIRKSLFSGLHRKDVQGELKLTVFGLFNGLGDQSQFLVTSDRFRSANNWTTHYRMSVDVAKKFPLSRLSYKGTVELGKLTNNEVVIQNELNFSRIYNGQHKSKIYVRLYAAAANGFNLNAAGQRGTNFSKVRSSDLQASGDYIYDGMFLGREETSGILSQQFMNTQGGMAVPTFQSANDKIFTLRLMADGPFKLPFRPYYSLGFLKNSLEYQPDEFKHTQAVANYKFRMLSAFGICFPLVPGVAEVYVPLYYSDNIYKELRLQGNSFLQNIMVELNLQSLEPSRMINQALD